MKDSESIDISGMPDVERLVEKVRQSQEPITLYRGEVAVAEIVPSGTHTRRLIRRRTKEGREAFLSAAGGWKDIVDADQLIADIYESRRISIKPPVDL